MKINTIDMIQHVNAAMMLVFSVFYSYLNGYYELGIVIWAFALPILYFPNLLTAPSVSEEEKKIAKRGSIIAGWLFVFFWWGLLFENNSFRIISVALFVFLIAYLIFHIRELRRNYPHKRNKEEKNRQ